MDDVDRRILRVLEADARTSLRKIAEEVGVALGTVSNRVRRLESLGVIRGYTVLLDPHKAGWGLSVVIGLRIEKGRLMEIQEKIAKDNRVYGVYDVTGEYDSMVLARASDVVNSVDPVVLCYLLLDLHQSPLLYPQSDDHAQSPSCLVRIEQNRVTPNDTQALQPPDSITYCPQGDPDLLSNLPE
jgi:DNA-binding Lrp family transcriptional regulator